jgi:hypothetical protein
VRAPTSTAQLPCLWRIIHTVAYEVVELSHEKFVTKSRKIKQEIFFKSMEFYARKQFPIGVNPFKLRKFRTAIAHN